MVPHLSTRHAHTGCLASEMRRDLSFPTRYDRTEDSSRVTSPDSGAVATQPRSIYRSTSKHSPQEKGTQDYDQNLDFAATALPSLCHDQPSNTNNNRQQANNNTQTTAVNIPNARQTRLKPNQQNHETNVQ